MFSNVANFFRFSFAAINALPVTACGHAAIVHPPSTLKCNAMADDDGVFRAYATDKTDKKPDEMRMNASLLIRDAAMLTQPGSSGAYILLAHAIELLLKAYLHKMGKSLSDLQRQYSHHIDKLLRDAKAQGLVVSDAETDNYSDRLAAAIDKAALRYDFSFANLPMTERLVRCAKSLERDVNATLT